MDGTIVVGLAGVVATAVTAWIGSWNNKKATGRTVEAGTGNTRATLAADRESRLWERRAASYEETVAGLLHRQRKRQRGVVLYKQATGVDPQRLRDYLASFKSPDWIESQARLVPYASDAVLAASNASQEADDQVWWLYHQWVGMLESNERVIEAGNPRAAFEAEPLLKAGGEVNVALETAGTLDQTLIDMIRSELRSRPEAAAPPGELPAQHRRLLGRGRGLHRRRVNPRCHCSAPGRREICVCAWQREGVGGGRG